MGKHNITEFNVTKINKKYRNMYGSKISIWLSILLNAIRISSSNYAKFIFHSYVFHLLSGCTIQKVLIVKLTIYKQIFLMLVAPSTKILLIMILHYCYFKTGEPDRTTTTYRYLIKRLWKVWFPYFYLSFCNCCAKQCILVTFIL